MIEPSKKQLELEQSICSISAYNKISKQNKNIEKGKESENYYARNLIEAGLDKLTKYLKEHIKVSFTGKAGRQVISAIYLAKFPDLDVVSFIAFKQIIDCISVQKTTTQTAIKIGQMLEDELRFTEFEKQDPKHFQAIKKHTRDTNHDGYKKRVMVHHMNRKGHTFEPWPKSIKMRVGLKLIELTAMKLKMIKFISKRVGKSTTSYVVFTDVYMKYIQQGRANRIALYPQLLPCYDKPRDWTSINDGGYFTKRLQTTAIKSTDRDHLKKVQEQDLTLCLKALSLASQTEWTVDKFVLDILEYCWEERIEVGSLIDRELKEVPTKPINKEQDPEAWKEWRYLASLIHDMNAQNRSKRYQIISMIDTAKKYVGEKFHHIYQFDWTGRMYPVTANFHPQGNDIARGLHIFNKGAAINNIEQLNWLAIAGANHYGLNKESYEDRIKFAHSLGTDWAEDVYKDPIGNIDIWGQAKEPFQFLQWCKEWSEFQLHGWGYVSHHVCCLDGTNNGYQHIAGLTGNQKLANKVNLQNVEKPQDLYKQVLDVLLMLIKHDNTEQAKEWYKERDKFTRAFIKKPVLMVPYNSTTYGIANYIEKYFVNENVFMAKNFKNNFYLATMIEQAVKYVTPESPKLLDHLTDIAKCFNKENKPIAWHSPSGFYVQQNYYQSQVKRVTTKISNSSIKLSLNETDKNKIDKRKQMQGFPSNYIHSLDAAHCHMSLVEASKQGLENFCIIHDCYGSPASELERFIECVKQSFFNIYSDNNLDNLYHQSVQQLSDSKSLPTALRMGSFDITDVLTAPYIFT
jgi:DNA-directed RNA polymerase|tara:strand:- start:3 stop:2399 length:2397 start_codon:yes stop_codon:yes gene_type:complete